jgi:hypothetical protein
MIYYNVLTPIPGGKELKFVKGHLPDNFPNIGEIMIPADTELIIAPKPFVLDDELHAKLSKGKEYTTYILTSINVPEEITPDTPAFFEEVLAVIDRGNVATLKESVFNYQIVQLEFYDF